MKDLGELRAQMTKINESIVNSLNEFIEISNKIGYVKDKRGLTHFDPVRESEI